MANAYREILFAVQSNGVNGFVDLFVTTDAKELNRGLSDIMTGVGSVLGNTGGKTTIRLVLKMLPGTKQHNEPDIRILGLFTIEILMTNSQVNALINKK